MISVHIFQVWRICTKEKNGAWINCALSTKRDHKLQINSNKIWAFLLILVLIIILTINFGSLLILHHGLCPLLGHILLNTLFLPSNHNLIKLLNGVIHHKDGGLRWPNHLHWCLQISSNKYPKKCFSKETCCSRYNNTQNFGFPLCSPKPLRFWSCFFSLVTLPATPAIKPFQGHSLSCGTCGFSSLCIDHRNVSGLQDLSP